MTHFTDAELIRWCEAGPGADRDRIVSHLAACGSCAARYAAALRTRPLDTSAAAEDPDDVRRFAEVGRRIGAPGAAVFPMRRRVLWIAAPLAAAAVIVLAVTVARRGGDQPDAGAAPVLRGATLHALTPDGETPADGRFAFSSGIAAARYRITVGGAAGPFYTAIVRGSPAPFPDDLRTQLKPGAAYWWTVAALDGEGRVIVVSERRPFTIRP
jgi:hypothetical protein